MAFKSVTLTAKSSRGVADAPLKALDLYLMLSQHSKNSIHGLRSYRSSKTLTKA